MSSATTATGWGSDSASESTAGSTGADATEPPLAPLEPGEDRPGGETTIIDAGPGAFLRPAANLRSERRAAFEAGLQFVALDWEATAGPSDIDGLGPTYNSVSCVACHARNGRGVVATEQRPDAPGVLLRLGSALGEPDPHYGNQLQPAAIVGVPSEGAVRWRDVPVRDVELPGGTVVSLVRRDYTIDQLTWGPLAEGTRISPRIAQQLVGMGLLEAIASDDIVAWADPDDADADGISGRGAWLPDGSLGRFGWKAAQPTVLRQNAAAFLGDLGITSDLFPDENCPPVQTACIAAAAAGPPDLTGTRLELSAVYIRLLGVPARRGFDEPAVRRGKTLFATTGCDRCHRPSFVTGSDLEPELAQQRIWPYTDLLLHDMGGGLADGHPEAAAEAREWRTPALWGLGLVATVNGERQLLHDGRARTLEEAILWHGGEAEAARRAYEDLSAPERKHLHRFIESL